MWNKIARIACPKRRKRLAQMFLDELYRLPPLPGRSGDCLADWLGETTAEGLELLAEIKDGPKN